VNGIKNLDYGSFHPPLFTGTVNIKVKFCDSSNNYLIQASDILANRIHSSFNYNLLRPPATPKTPYRQTPLSLTVNLFRCYSFATGRNTLFTGCN